MLSADNEINPNLRGKIHARVGADSDDAGVFC